MSARLIIIAAVDEAMGVGKDGGIPWHLPEDLKRFRALTHGGIVCYGYKTWRSLPIAKLGQVAARMLPYRHNVLITDRPVMDRREFDPNGSICDSVKFALELTEEAGVGPLYVVGGHDVWMEALDLAVGGVPTLLFLTRVKGNYQCDTFFPPVFDANQNRGWTQLLDRMDYPEGPNAEYLGTRFQIYSNF